MRLKPLMMPVLGVLLVAVSLLEGQENRQATDQAIAASKRLKGQVKREGNGPDKPLVSVDLPGTRASVDDLEPLKGLIKLQPLNLYNTKITDAGLAHLEGIPSLGTLYLNDTQITDAGLVHLKGLTRLAQLGLYRTHISDE